MYLSSRSHLKYKENWSYTVSCVKIWGYLLKIKNPLSLGQIKLCMDPLNKNPKKQIQNFDFSICKIVLLYKKKNASENFFFNFFDYAFMYLERSVKISELRTKLETFEYWPSYRQQTTIFWTTSLIFLKTLHMQL